MNLNKQPEVNCKYATYTIDDFSLEEYLDLIQIRALPDYKVTGNSITFRNFYLDEKYRKQAENLPLDLTDDLFDYQKVITKVAYLKERYAIFADAGLGKCMGVDTPIIMYDGSVKMIQDIKKDDLLMGPDSKPRKVLSTTTGVDDLFRVNPVKGDSFVCNSVHVLSLRCTGTKQNDNSSQFIKNKIVNIPLDDYLNKGKMWKSYYKLWRTGVHFENTVVQFDPYLVGLYLGDGHKQSPAITTADRNIEVIEYIENWAKGNNLEIRYAKTGKTTSRFFTNDGKHNGIHYQLKDLCYQDNEKRIPDNYLINDSNIRLELLAGLIDSDGYHNDNCYEIVSKYEGLAKDIAFLARSLGFGVTERDVEKGISSGGYAGFKSIYYKVTIYGDTHKIPVKVQRKKAKIRKQKKNVLNTGFDVEYIGKDNYYGFTLDGDGLYLLGDFTVTHNTNLIGELTRQIYTSETGKIIICMPLNIMRQFEEMVTDFFPDFPEFDHLHGKKITLEEWCKTSDKRVCFVNHERFIKEQNLVNVAAFLLDEGSILKGGQGGNGKIAKNIISATLGIKYKYAASATPAPNDRTEYAMIAQFLEIVRTEFEFYSLFFTIKDDKYVLKRHAVKAFYKYLASFSIFIRSPKKYGFIDNLEGLKDWKEIYKRVDMTPEQLGMITNHAVKAKQANLPGIAIKPSGMAQRGKFSQISKGFVYTTRNGKRTSEFVKSNKPDVIKDIVESHPNEQFIIWTVFDEEGDILERKLSETGLKIVHITGKTKELDRIKYIESFRKGEIDVIISKPRILGFGLNFQFCHIAIYSGLQDSYEKYYQSIKRIHRYGQEKQVLIYHVFTEYEEVILQNVLKKQTQMQNDFEYQERLYIESLYDELQQWLKLEDYKPMVEQTVKIEPVITDSYQLYHGDSIKMLTEIANNEKEYDFLKKDSIDFSVFSPPFMGDVFTYTNDPADMGNTRGAGAKGGLDEFMMQFQFFLRGMLAVIKPGRIMAMHLEDVPLRKNLDGFIGLFDFVGESIRQATTAGWILTAKIPIIKNQQMTAIVKKVSSLSMSNMEKDRLRIAPCQNGNLILFRKPGDANIKVSDIAKCENCKWQGYAQELNNWQADRQYKSNWLMDVLPNCPQCDSQNVIVWKDMNGNKWIMLAEGVWTDNAKFNPNEMDNWDSIAKSVQSKRWQDIIYTSLGVWPDINEPDTLQNPFSKATDADADKHLCPLPIEIARRAIEMYTLPGETVLTPFMGIGTEIDQSLRLSRKAIGIELKPEYFVQSKKVAENAVSENTQFSIFDLEMFTNEK